MSLGVLARHVVRESIGRGGCHKLALSSEIDSTSSYSLSSSALEILPTAGCSIECISFLIQLF
jgi:hypothetical protein